MAVVTVHQQPPPSADLRTALFDSQFSPSQLATASTDEPDSGGGSSSSLEASQSSTSNNTLSSSNGDAAGSSQSSVEHEAEAEVARGAGMMKMDTDGDADMDGGMVVDIKTDASRTADFKTGLGTEPHGTAQYSRANGHRVTDVKGTGSSTSTGVFNGTANTLHGSAALPRLQTDTHTDEARNGLDLPDDAVARHGQKRTASGHVKTPTTATARLSTSPVRERPLSSVDQGRSHSQRHSHSQSYSYSSYSSYSHGHKRTTSTNTQVNELSVQLRARLSYAMLKVQNGWESRTLDEVEALAAAAAAAAAAGTARSAGTGSSPGSLQNSPLAAAAAAAAPGTGTGGSSSAWRRTSSPRSTGTHATAAARIATAQASRALNGSLARERHDARAARGPPLLASSSSSSALHAPALAPALDFTAAPASTHARARRTTVSGRPPPSYLGSSHKTLASVAPAHMHSDDPLLTRQTPSQRATAASERDAIETLLFMSSPGNSQTFARGSASAAHAHMPAPLAVDQVPLSPRKRGLLDGTRLATDEGIDRVLDLMPRRGSGRGLGLGQDGADDSGDSSSTSSCCSGDGLRGVDGVYVG